MFEIFNEFTPAWILISSIIGGIVGASIKFLFERILSRRFNRNSEAKEALKQYSFPLLKSAASFHKRLDFIISDNRERVLYNEHPDGYSIYKLSTLYPICHFLGSGVIIQNEALKKFHTVGKRAKKFHIAFYNVYKGMSSMYYFSNNEELKGTYEESTVPSFVLSAIGEQMIEINQNNAHYDIIGFNQFVSMVKSDSNFREWINYLDQLLIKINPDKSKKDWNRLLLIAIHIRILEKYLDKKRNFTIDKKFHEYFDQLHPSVQEKLTNDLTTLKKFKIIKTMP